MGLFSSLMGNAGYMDPEEIQEDYGRLFADTEEVEIGFKLIRDTFIFTNKRLILVDKQGVTGRKMEYLSIPYKSIARFSIETSGHFDLDAELKIWIGSDPVPLEKKFSKKVDIYDVQKVLATYVCK
ncbi:PH domain-containing protein [Flexithrix dorotheae]|uniref:PH domain-containing protein n=1 Tax=Flexithrix dorotheae TaxID=70993 RepID=UPI00036F0D51|nr:PH domain-containing protein [Flexithrix dorotheae]